MALTQFVKCALIGEDGNYVVFSPFVDGVEGASKNLLQTETGEEVKIEDDQTVFTSVKNTITIVSALSDADAAKVRAWIDSDYVVGFAGYTIGGLVYAPMMENDAPLVFQKFMLAVDGTNAALRGDAFYVSEFARLNDIKHTYKITLTQDALGGVTSRGLSQGLEVSHNMLAGTTVRKNITATGNSTTLAPYGVGGGPTNSYSHQASGTGVRFTAGTGSAGQEYTTNMFFPFDGTFSLGITGNTSATGGFASVKISSLNAAGSPLANASITLATAAATTGATSVPTIPTFGKFVRFALVKNAASGNVNIDDAVITFNPL